MRTYVNNKFLVLFMTLFCFCEMMQAAKWTDQGKYDISWYNDLSSSFDISTARQLAGLIYLCNNGNSFTGKTILIKADMDLSANDWVPINDFSGTLDGGFHKISGLKVNHKNSTLGPNYFSFALMTTLNGTVRNLNLQVSFELYSHGYDEIWVSGICKTNNGSVINCIMNGTISALNDGDGVALGYHNSAGAFACINKGDIINCVNYANINSKPYYYDYKALAYAGGISAVNNGNILNCQNFGDVSSRVGYNSSSWKGGWGITTHAYSGGIAGVNTGTISNVVNLGNMYVTIVKLGNTAGTNGHAGCIAASNSGTISYAYSSSSSIIEAPHIVNHALTLDNSQIQNNTYQFTTLLNQNVSNLNNEGICYWANSPTTKSNIPFHLNGFALAMQISDAKQNIVTFTAIPKDIVSSAIVSKGFEYKKDTDSNYKKVNCQDEFTVSVTDLDLSAKYTVRPFVVTVNGKTLYWEETNFSTGQIEVETEEATEITANTAVLHGNVQSGAASIKSQGFLWKSENESNFQVVYSEGQDFQYKLEKLTPNTTYTYQAFVLTTDGENIYGNTKTFTTRPITIEISETNLDRNSIYLKGRTSISISTNVTIEYKKSTESNYTKLSVVSNDDGCFECTLSDLLPNTSYDCRVHIVYNNAYVYSQTYTYKTLNVSVRNYSAISHIAVVRA